MDGPSYSWFTEDIPESASGPQTGRYLSHFFEQACDEHLDATAVLCGSVHLTYRELDCLANRVAHLLTEQGVGQGDPVGILLERSPELYMALLGILKVGAVFVPLDPSFPVERISFIAQDAGLHMLITDSALQQKTTQLRCQILTLNCATEALARQPETRLPLTGDISAYCYIIYTSGSTGQPKGVAISHANITNYLRVVAPIVGVTKQDHVYQGTTITFDTALEEIWFTWLAGATLVVGPTDTRRLGHELAEFLCEHEITILYCVPTLLSTLDRKVPSLRLLILGGEACLPHLVRQWSRPGLRILNTYGPTETTIAATWSEVSPDSPITIGVPYPTYRVFLLDTQLYPVAQGEIGELCIAGPGVASGYLNRPDLTRERFVPNPFEHEGEDAPLLYRTGDLGRLTSSGEIIYVGRLDRQVKLRGYRIELEEIEAVLCQHQAVKQACVMPLIREGVVQDLIAYVTLHADESATHDPDLLEQLHASLLETLPTYMIPAFIEKLAAFPCMVSGKVDRARLPPPSLPRFSAQSCPQVPPANDLEKRLVTVWEEVLGCTQVSCDDDFFMRLGGHSLAAARVISRLRQEPAWQTLAIGDLYQHPTIRRLAHFIATHLTCSTDTQETHGEAKTVQCYPLRRILRCGVVQLVLIYLLSLVGSFPLLAVREELANPWTFVFLIVVMGIWFTLLGCLLPIVVGRLLMRGIQPGKYPLWGKVYLRYWLYDKTLKMSPLRTLTGSPFCSLYLRLLGAKVGRNCHFAAVKVGILKFMRIDDEVSINYGSQLKPAIVENGWLSIAPIHLGRGVFLGANSVVLAGATIGDHTAIAEQSLVSQNQAIPAREYWGGSPSERLESPPPVLDELAARADGRCWPLSVLFGFIAGIVLLQVLPWLLIVPSLLLILGVTLHVGPAWGLASIVLAGPLFVLTTCAVVIVGKRSVMPGARPGIYPIRSWFGFRKWLSDQLMRISMNLTKALYGTLYVIPFLRLLGARIGAWCEVSTVSYLDPDMLTLTGESFIADIAVVGAAIFYHGSVALAPSVVGQRSFVGNGAVISGASYLEDRSLVGVHSMALMQQHFAPETTWLGSPAILLPRRQASAHFDETLTYRPRLGQIIKRLAIEYWRVTLPAIIPALSLFGIFFASFQMSAVLSPLLLLLLLPVLLVGGSIAAVCLIACLKWSIIGRYRPRVEPLWSSFVRRSELITGLYEVIVVPFLLAWLTGTPWIAPCLRLFGAHIGQRVWLNTTFLSEFDLVEVGDDAAIGEETSLQTHLFEDRVMKMSVLKIGNASSIGSRSVVLYDAEIGAVASLDALSLVMKGETLPAGSHWRGIPAQPVQP